LIAVKNYVRIQLTKEI